jgi:hypothetical protein
MHRPPAAIVSNANEVQRLPAGEPANGDSRYEQGGSAASAAAASAAAAVAADKETPPVHGLLYSSMPFTVETCRTERRQQVRLQHQSDDEERQLVDFFDTHFPHPIRRALCAPREGQTGSMCGEENDSEVEKGNWFCSALEGKLGRSSD